MTANFVLYII